MYNTTTYPNLMRLFAELDIKTQPSNMSFSLSCRDTGFEYGNHSLRGFLAKKRNLINPDLWQMIIGYLRFSSHSRTVLNEAKYASYTLGQYIEEKQYSASLTRHLLIPMTSAIWSSPRMKVTDFPVRYLVQFYANHGVLNLFNKVEWRTVTGGSHMYVQKLVQPFADRIHLNSPVRAVHRHDNGVTLTLADGSRKVYDHVVIATHSDQALRLLADPSPAEGDILGAIPYQENTAVFHTDEQLLPRRRAAWASWNYILPKGFGPDRPASLTYWMNSLQNLDSDTNYCVTINPAESIQPERIIQTIQYQHPVYSLKSIEARRRLPEINGQRRTHFCGAYCGYGFHEDGITSGLAVAEQLGVSWDYTPTSDLFPQGALGESFVRERLLWEMG